MMDGTKILACIHNLEYELEQLKKELNRYIKAEEKNKRKQKSPDKFGPERWGLTKG